MYNFLAVFIIALLVSSVGFKKYVWFISLGYGYSIAAISAAMFVIFLDRMTFGTVIIAVILLIYGLRLGGFLLLSEKRTKEYNEKMKKETKSGKDMNLFVKICIWVLVSFLYACQMSPLLFRLDNDEGTDFMLIIGMLISIVGAILETVADFQKAIAKTKNPKRFVDTGLYRIVRCPNYFGELLLWTGVFIGGVTVYASAAQWILSVLGYLGIVYVVLSGAKRLEERQNRIYGGDSEYMEYRDKTPIIIPFVPIYSVVKHKWLVG